MTHKMSSNDEILFREYSSVLPNSAQREHDAMIYKKANEYLADENRDLRKKLLLTRQALWITVAIFGAIVTGMTAVLLAL